MHQEEYTIYHIYNISSSQLNYWISELQIEKNAVILIWMPIYSSLLFNRWMQQYPSSKT